MPLLALLLIHMKLMLFTDFLQTHQSNLHPSDRFPHLDFTKIFGGDANPSNNHRVKTGLWDLRETETIRNLSENSAVSIRQRACTWAFEWKIIQNGAWHGPQRKTTSSCRLLQHNSCRSLLVFLPSGHFTHLGGGLVWAPQQWGWESESRRFRVWGRWGRGSPLGPDWFTLHLDIRLFSQAGPLQA